MLNKQSAMFGLDARIALAIFGALSIISGAALYGALKKAEDIALLNNLNEIGKAFEQYYLDTGLYMPRYEVNDKTNLDYHHFIGKALISNINNLNGWKGPYLQTVTLANHLGVDNFLKNPLTDTGIISFVQANDNIWTDWYTDLCTSGSSCYIWVILSGFDNGRDFKSLDEIIDGGDGSTNGDFRWQSKESAGNPIYYKYMITPNPM